MPRIIFKKCDEIKYISHLDLMRTFNRMLSRAEIPVKYTEGFNPHVILNFALPLSVGMTSDRELAEISLSYHMTNDEIKERLIKAAPAGIEITDVTDDTLPQFKDVTKAEFTLKVYSNKKACDFMNYLALDEIITEKKTKKGVKEVDIKPMILAFNANDSDEGYFILDLTLLAGNSINLNPSLIIKAAEQYIENFEVSYVEIKRNCLLTDKNEKF